MDHGVEDTGTALARTQVPIDNLPDDILRLIFQFYIDPLSLYVRELSVVTSRLRLVSHFWNETILHHPRLWSSVRISYSDPHSRPPPLTVIQRLLNLSAEVPLCIHLTMGSATGTGIITFIEVQTLYTLSEAIHRWRSLHICLNTTTIVPLVHVFQHFDFSKAHKLDFASLMMRCKDSLGMEEIMKKLVLAPAITELRWAPCNLPCSDIMIQSFPLHRLQTLYLVYFAISQTVDILRRCTSAKHITLYFSQPGLRHALSPHVEPLYLSNLRVLEIVSSELDSPFLPLLHLPCLSIFCFHFVDYSDGKNAPPQSSVFPSKLQVLLQRCPALQILIINSLPFMELPEVLYTPSVQALRVVEVIYLNVQHFYDFETTLHESRERESTRDIVPSNDDDGGAGESPAHTNSAESTLVDNTNAPAPSLHGGAFETKADSHPPANVPSLLRRKKWEVKPLTDGALIVGWCEPKLDEMFDSTIPMSYPVTMCSRTTEWWRVLREEEGLQS